MKRAFVTSSAVLAALLLVAACGSSSRGDLSSAETQRRFGVRMAKMNLWREAMFRFKRATEIEPANAMAHNNLAVAYEATGDFDAALREYREALRLDRSNEYIQKNYSRFVEFTQKSKKREAAKPPVASAAGVAGVETAGVETAAPAVVPPTTTTTTTTGEAPVATPRPTPTPTPTPTTTNPPEEGFR